MNNNKKEKSVAYILGFLIAFVFLGIFALIPAFCIGGDFKKGVFDGLKWFVIIFFSFIVIVFLISLIIRI